MLNYLKFFLQVHELLLLTQGLLVAAMIGNNLINLCLYLIFRLLKLPHPGVNLTVLLNLNSKQTLLEEIGSVGRTLVFLGQNLDTLVSDAVREEKTLVLVVWLCKGSERAHFLLDLLWSQKGCVVDVLFILSRLFSLLHIRHVNLVDVA